MKLQRKHYIDNIRWITMCVVVFYHVIYIYNSSGVVSSINVRGIPQMDIFMPFVYPWFMALLFLVAGVSARYSLAKRSARAFAANRTKKVLIPTISGIFLLGWAAGGATAYYAPDLQQSIAQMPAIGAYFIKCFVGMGPLWFGHELFIICMFLLILRAFDRNDLLWKLGGKANLLVLFLLYFPVWGSAQILNVPLITVYRFGIYPTCFLLGYYVFSHGDVTAKLKKVWVPLAAVFLALGIYYAISLYGRNNTAPEILTSWITNLYLWIAILAILAVGQRFLDFETRFTRYMTANNFSFYVLHYPVIVSVGFALVRYMQLPFVLNYIIVLAAVIAVLPLLTAILKRIPVMRFLLLGEGRQVRQNEH